MGLQELLESWFCALFFPSRKISLQLFWVASADARTACIRASLLPPPKEGFGCHRLRCLQAYRSALLRLWEVLALSRQPLKAESCAAVPSRAFSNPSWSSQLSGSCTHRAGGSQQPGGHSSSSAPLGAAVAQHPGVAEGTCVWTVSLLC